MTQEAESFFLDKIEVNQEQGGSLLGQKTDATCFYNISLLPAYIGEWQLSDWHRSDAYSETLPARYLGQPSFAKK